MTDHPRAEIGIAKGISLFATLMRFVSVVLERDPRLLPGEVQPVAFPPGEIPDGELQTGQR